MKASKSGYPSKVVFEDSGTEGLPLDSALRTLTLSPPSLSCQVTMSCLVIGLTYKTTKLSLTNHRRLTPELLISGISALIGQSKPQTRCCFPKRNARTGARNGTKGRRMVTAAPQTAEPKYNIGRARPHANTLTIEQD